MRRTGFKNYLGKLRDLWLLGMLLLLCSRQTSSASLVITIYHGETMYIAADSAATLRYDGEQKYSVQKIYPFAHNCCAAITGTASLDLMNSAGETEFSMHLWDALARACAQQMTNPAMLDQKMVSIAADVNQAFARYNVEARKLTANVDNPGSTVLEFVGYNAARGCFFASSCELDRTNTVNIKLAKEYRGPNDAMPLTFQGEPRFLQTLFSGDKPELLSLVSDKFKGIARRLVSTEPIDDASVTNFILEMYSLHTANSDRLGYSQGGVGPPYRIFKITKQKVAELTPVPTVVTTSFPSIAQSHAEDDKAIDAVMEKLAKSIKDNDYSYVFQVMYTPIVESMGGKEKLFALVPVLKEQMKQQQLKEISWESRRPYVYLKGYERWYAVIPYVSEMTMAGQKLRVTGFQLGIKNDGSEWQFVGGDKLTPQIFETFFQDFPRDYSLPKVQRVFE